MILKHRIFAIIFPVIVILDQITKQLVLQYIPLGKHITIVEGFFDLVHFRNPGAAFGMFANASAGFRSSFFYLIAAFATVMLFFYFRSLHKDDRLMATTLSLIFGGMLGNIIDRLRFNEVVDFLFVHFHHKAVSWELFGKQINFTLEWPAFNVADSAITVSMFLLFFSLIRDSRQKKSS